MTSAARLEGDIGDPDWKKRRVLELLDGALVPGDRERLQELVSPEVKIVFPGFEARGHAGVDELLAMIDTLFDGCPTKSYDLWICEADAVNVHGVLYGRMKDGRSMDGTRYTDTFRFGPDGRVTHWLVFNDLALLPA
ncbi:MAG TPA: nuclear transport factor 2 family protein [Gammaproteobacteria bacterium]|nr:nuclear transport factor 2 family protein [Gammaproteobacteria bacterium]